MLRRGFIIFRLFLLFFWEFSCPGRVWTEFRPKFFFFLFLGLYHPVLAKNNAGKRFFNFFLNFLLFFSEFSCPARIWTELGAKIFFSLSWPHSNRLDRNNAEINFFNFLNFLAIFVGIFLLGLGTNRIRD